MFMEMATGGELFDLLISAGSLSEEAAWPYISALVSGVLHCHKLGVVHRDLKLENVMLCSDDPRAIRIIDFGLAVVLPLAEDGSIKESLLEGAAGTPSYRAPEVTTGPYSPPGLDVWSLGILSFSLVAGFFPLQASDGAARVFPITRRLSSAPCAPPAA